MQVGWVTLHPGIEKMGVHTPESLQHLTTIKGTATAKRAGCGMRSNANNRGRGVLLR